jgi:hypothetical protein
MSNTTTKTKKAAKTVEVTCHRCNGSGTYSFHRQYGTVCFECNGAKTLTITEAALKARQRKAEKRAAEAKQREAQRLETAAKAEAVIAALAARYADDPRMAKLAEVPAQYHYMALIDWFRFDLSQQGIQVPTSVADLGQYL